MSRHHWLNGHEFEQTPGDGERQGILVCCSPWGCKESDMSDWTTKKHLTVKITSFFIQGSFSGTRKTICFLFFHLFWVQPSIWMPPDHNCLSQIVWKFQCLKDWSVKKENNENKTFFMFEFSLLIQEHTVLLDHEVLRVFFLLKIEVINRFWVIAYSASGKLHATLQQLNLGWDGKFGVML